MHKHVLFLCQKDLNKGLYFKLIFRGERTKMLFEKQHQMLKEKHKY